MKLTRALFAIALACGFGTIMPAARAQITGAISQLPPASVPLSNEQTPVVQNGIAKRASALAFGVPAAGTSVPTPIAAGQFWLDESTSPYTLRQWDGTSWAPLTTVDPTAHSGVQPLANGGTGQVTPQAARAGAGLNIDSATPVGDGNYQILATDRTLVTNHALSAPRVWTLPAAAAVNPGQMLIVLDSFGAISGSNTLTLIASGSDHIAGAPSVALTNTYSGSLIVSDGVSTWTLYSIPMNLGGSTVAGGDLNGTYPNPQVRKIDGQTPAAVATSGSASDLGTGTLPNGRLSGVPNSALANAAITLGGQSVALGASAATTGNGNKLCTGTGSYTPGHLVSVDANGNCSDSGSASAPAAPGGTSGQIQYNNSGVLAGETIVPQANGGTGNSAGTATPSGTAGGDLSGSYPNPTVSQVGGHALAATAPLGVSNSNYSCPTCATTGTGGALSASAPAQISSGGNISVNTFTTSTPGTAPASGGGTTNYLRADGTWSAPPAGTPAGTNGQVQINNSGAFGVSNDVATGAASFAAFQAGSFGNFATRVFVDGHNGPGTPGAAWYTKVSACPGSISPDGGACAQTADGAHWWDSDFGRYPNLAVYGLQPSSSPQDMTAAVNSAWTAMAAANVSHILHSDAIPFGYTGNLNIPNGYYLTCDTGTQAINYASISATMPGLLSFNLGTAGSPTGYTINSGKQGGIFGCYEINTPDLAYYPSPTTRQQLTIISNMVGTMNTVSQTGAAAHDLVVLGGGTCFALNGGGGQAFYDNYGDCMNGATLENLGDVPTMHDDRWGDYLFKNIGSSKFVQIPVTGLSSGAGGACQLATGTYPQQSAPDSFSVLAGDYGHLVGSNTGCDGPNWSVTVSGSNITLPGSSYAGPSGYTATAVSGNPLISLSSPVNVEDGMTITDTSGSGCFTNDLIVAVGTKDSPLGPSPLNGIRVQTNPTCATSSGSVSFSNPAYTQVIMTASIGTNVLTVSAISQGTIVPATTLFLNDGTVGNVPYGVAITSQLTGTTGGTGTYQLSQTVGTVASEAMTAGAVFDIFTNVRNGIGFYGTNSKGTKCTGSCFDYAHETHFEWDNGFQWANWVDSGGDSDPNLHDPAQIGIEFRGTASANIFSACTIHAAAEAVVGIAQNGTTNVVEGCTSLGESDSSGSMFDIESGKVTISDSGTGSSNSSFVGSGITALKLVGNTLASTFVGVQSQATLANNVFCDGDATKPGSTMSCPNDPNNRTLWAPLDLCNAAYSGGCFTLNQGAAGALVITAPGVGAISFSINPTTGQISGLLPVPTTTARGGVIGLAGGTPHNVVQYIDTVTGAQNLTRLGCGDLSTAAPSCSTDTTNASNISSGTLAAAQGGAGAVNGALAGNGSGAVSQAACAGLSNAAPSCSTDTTNAANITSGTLPAARLPVPTTGALGGVESISCTSGKFITVVPTTAVQPTCTTPVTGATEQSTSSNPATPGTTSSFLMQGLAGSITTTKTGNVLITISGYAAPQNAVTDGIKFQISYGTSTPPSNGHALTGTQVGSVEQSQVGNASVYNMPFSITAVVTGLTVGTTYWIDLAAELTAGTTSTLNNVTIAAVEIS